MNAEGHRITREDYENNIEEKMKHPGFLEDVKPMLAADMNYDVKAAFPLIREQIIARI
jgi:hypothetical protein